MDNSCVIGGTGMVGRATMLTFGIKKYFSRHDSNITLNDAAKCKFIFLCLPTPTVNGKCDISVIEEIVSQLAEIGCSGVIINRSTVTPGTVKHLAEKYNVAIVSNPEFLTESTMEEDAKHPDIIVIGSDVPAWGEALKGLYEARFKGVNLFMTDSITAETVKYAINTFYATKVVFANQLYDICQKIGANYEMVKNIMYKRKWIGQNHLDVWHQGGRGANGKCLEKDLEAFAKFADNTFLLRVNVENKDLLQEYPKNGRNDKN